MRISGQEWDRRSKRRVTAEQELYSSLLRQVQQESEERREDWRAMRRIISASLGPPQGGRVNQRRCLGKKLEEEWGGSTEEEGEGEGEEGEQLRQETESEEEQALSLWKGQGQQRLEKEKELMS